MHAERPNFVLLRLSLVVLALAMSTSAAVAQRQPRPADLDPKVREIYRHYPVVELVTMGIGSLVWEKHGHIALCVRYRQRHRDRCYNYGTADFANPLSMAWGFFRGTQSFWASKSTPGSMLRIYERTDRTIWVQPLPLTPEQEQQVIDKLESDIRPENRYYAYDHFWDNCTTRVRDIIDDATDGALSSMDEPAPKETIRDLAREGFYGMRGVSLITDIAMGRPTDRPPSYWERMFLPQFLREAVSKRFGIEPLVVYQRRGPPHPDDGPSGRFLLACIIILITAPTWASRLFGRFHRTAIGFAIFVPVVLGLVLWFLAIISPLSYVQYNESLLIFFPFDLALLVLPAAQRRLYGRVRVGMLGLVALLMAVSVLKQPLWAPLLWPLIPAAVVGFWPPAPPLAQPPRRDADGPLL